MKIHEKYNTYLQFGISKHFIIKMPIKLIRQIPKIPPYKAKEYDWTVLSIVLKVVTKVVIEVFWIVYKFVIIGLMLSIDVVICAPTPEEVNCGTIAAEAFLITYISSFICLVLEYKDSVNEPKVL